MRLSSTGNVQTPVQVLQYSSVDARLLRQVNYPEHLLAQRAHILWLWGLRDCKYPDAGTLSPVFRATFAW